MHLHPIKFMVCAGSSALSLGIYTFAVCERRADAVENYAQGFGDATYVLLVTITGVGYGDITPQTVCGRMVSVTLAISFVMFTAVLVAVINTKIRLTTEEPVPLECEIGSSEMWEQALWFWVRGVSDFFVETFAADEDVDERTTTCCGAVSWLQPLFRRW